MRHGARREPAPTSSCARAPTAGRSSCSRSPTTPHIVARRARDPASGASTGTRASGGRRSTTGSRVHVADVLDRFPELTTSDEVDALAARRRAPLDRARATDAPRRPRLVRRCETRAGTLPEALREGAVERDGRAARAADRGGRRRAARAALGARLDAAAERCVAVARARRRRRRRRGSACQQRRRRGAAARGAVGPGRRRRVRAPAGRRGRPPLPLDPWLVEHARRVPRRCTTSRSTAGRGAVLARAARRARRGGGRVRRSRATEAEPIAEVAACSAASCSRSSGPACATRSTRAARSSPTSRASARPSRRSPRWRPTTRTRRSSSAPRR